MHPRSDRVAVEETASGMLRVRVTAPPEGGKANREVIRLVAAHFDLPSSRVKIVRGRTCRDKTIVLEYG